jgi:hypothetical protein
MFTGFASENTPAIQVWDFFNTQSGASTTNRIALADDCAPIQYFKTGANATAIQLFLPTAPIEGKQITIVNANYTSTNQLISIYSSDTNGAGTTSPFISIGSGQTLNLCYSKNFIFVNANGQFNTGWISLNQSPIGAYAFNSVVLGGNNNSAINSRSAVLGGSTNSASGQSSVVVGGSSNTASGSNSAVIGGDSSSASGTNSVVIGGASGQSASGQRCVIAGGAGGTASANNCFIGGGTSNATTQQSAALLGGSGNTANAVDSVIIGGEYGITRSIQANTVAPASINPVAAIQGASQSAILVLGRQTTDATATVLLSNASGAGTTNQIILPNNAAYYFRGSITAGVTGAGNSAMWSFEGGIKRGANAASTVLVGTAVLNLVAQDAGASTWVVALTADTTNGGLAVTVTGQASTTIRWVCKVETTEMTF